MNSIKIAPPFLRFLSKKWGACHFWCIVQPSCEDLVNVTICDNSKPDSEIKIDDRAFQYCKRLETVDIGNGAIEMGEYVFSGCADNLAITIAGKNYTADAVKDGLK